MAFRKSKTYTPEEIRAKALRYCAQQEHCLQEVRQKVKDWGLPASQINGLLAELKREGFIDERRYAESFARGKFRIKRWGKQKIAHALQQKELRSGDIYYGLSQLDEAEYWETLEMLAEKLEPSVKETDPFLKRDKLAKKLITKGFEPALVWDLLKSWSFGEPA
ncbi:MAG: regulatory protein RecX [Salibacteraceae bacterium]